MSAPCEPRVTAPASAPPPSTLQSPPPSPPPSPTIAPAARRPALDWRIRFAGLSLIWGFSFLLIKVGTEGYAPFQVTFGRLLAGTAVLVAAMAMRRERLPRSARTWGHLTVAALLLNALPFSLFSYAELTIPSTLAGICNATSPLWGMALSVVALSEDRPTRRRVAGLGVGFLGVLTVLGAWQGFSGLDLPGTGMALLASFCYPVGWIYVRRTLAGTGASTLALTGSQLFLGTLQLAVVTPVFTSAPTSFPLLPTLSVLALGGLGTGLAVLLQFGLVQEVGPTTAQMVTYFIPVIATAAGVALLGEQLAWNTPVGALIVLVGAALTQSRPRPAAPPEPVAAPVTARREGGEAPADARREPGEASVAAPPEPVADRAVPPGPEIATRTGPRRAQP
ncbi:Permease of the drug/metabolite transporter (DMT) superfamily [Streptomyces sp. MnatMP-M77]|uniref:DMT family transporter n=1 Tax=unclassified Streptomyces TaxID=2593676 RepID=UPI0008056961|nr:MULTISPECIES: DMT family transporter [unclassified Streptomyces]SBV04025.1 Permease of the drug/metabolite transporter (DMT) superfamily [Streptomyces sp. MnatMP-M77]SCE61935.1 Permease of the drug/metabolite transporter (DMT) superfamily [Streptomyces sp. OspMP-M43]